jgi:hypothetical protein
MKKNPYEIIDISVKKMLMDGKIDQYDIPELILLLTELSTTHFLPTSTEDLDSNLHELYSYVMNKFDLYPKKKEQREIFDNLFKSSIKLVLYQPVIQTKCSKFWGTLTKNKK